MADVDGVDVNLTTLLDAVGFNSEVAINRPLQLVPGLSVVRMMILAWMQVTLGVGATAIIPAVRRGQTAADPLIGERNSLAVQTTPASLEPAFIMVMTTLQDQAIGRARLTLEVSTAGANGSEQSCVLMISLSS